MTGQDMVVAVVAFGGATYVLSSVVRVIGKALESRHQPAVNGENAQRLERMEQAIDAIALEIERISEGQRFTTRLLAERDNGNALPAAKPPVQS